MQPNIPKTKEAFEILKTRWPEVVFIIALGVLSFSMIPIAFHLTGNPGYMLMTLVPFAFYIIILIFLTGFQRTVYLEDRKQQSLFILFQEGKHFFWRLFGLGLIYFLAMGCLQIFVLWTIQHTAPDFMETRLGAATVSQLPPDLVSLILMKPVLLIFPLIIAFDCGIFTSFKMLGQCRLRDTRELVILFLISLGLPFLLDLLPYHNGVTILHYFIMILRVIVSQFIDLMIAVMAIRYVAVQNLRYDKATGSSDAQDLVNSSI